MLPNHEIEIRVRYYETDAQGFVHHANYFQYFELARVEQLLALGYHYADLERELAVAIRQIETSRVETVDPDAKSLLSSLRAKKLRLGVISNWSADLAQYLARHGLAEYFDTIIASEAVGASKPHKEIFLKGLAALGCPPGNAVHVGDDYWADVVGARDLGMSPVLIDRDRESVHSDCPTIARLRDLEGLLHI
jgi:HAD superfamily hydrolase (TIGR01549 family)